MNDFFTHSECTCSQEAGESGPRAILADVMHVRPGFLVFPQTERLFRLEQLGDFRIRIVLVAEDSRLGRADLDACRLQAIARAVIAERAFLHPARFPDRLYIRPRRELI